jgi:hypothetical protein
VSNNNPTVLPALKVHLCVIRVKSRHFTRSAKRRPCRKHF